MNVKSRRHSSADLTHAMNKSDLKRLGSLWKLQEKLHNEWVDSGYSEELCTKINMVKKIKKQLEEQKRGFLKSKVPYYKMADFLVDNALMLSTLRLQEGLISIFTQNKR